MFNRQEGGIQCCRYCGPPQRHVGCHATCETYIQAKQEYDEKQAEYRKQLGQIIDQDNICKNRKRRYLDAVHRRRKQGG